MKPVPIKESRAIVARVAAALQDLIDEVVFVGGSATAFLITDDGIVTVRPTLDVDVIVEVINLPGYYKFEKRLKKLGFVPDPDGPVPEASSLPARLICANRLSASGPRGRSVRPPRARASNPRARASSRAGPLSVPAGGASLASIIQPAQWMRFYAARDSRTLRRSAIARPLPWAPSPARKADPAAARRDGCYQMGRSGEVAGEARRIRRLAWGVLPRCC